MRAGVLVLPLTGYSTQESGPCTWLGQQRRVSPDGEAVEGEKAEENWPSPSPAVALGRVGLMPLLGSTVELTLGAGELALRVRVRVGELTVTPVDGPLEERMLLLTTKLSLQPPATESLGIASFSLLFYFLFPVRWKQILAESRGFCDIW